MEADRAGGGRRRSASLRLAVAMVALCASGAGCGLPDSFYLSPPSASQAQPLDGLFTIQHTDRSSEPDFRGYELYYKLYSSAPPAADTNLGSTTGTVDLLTSNGFLTLCKGPVVTAPSGASSQAVSADVSVATRVAPLILIDPNDRNASFTVTINVNPAGGTDAGTSYSYAAPSGSYQQEIDRHVTGSIATVGVQRCMPFTYGQGYYQQTDPDISAIWPVTGGTLYIAVYAVSYGLQNLSTPIYSYPVYMGYLTISGNFSS